MLKFKKFLLAAVASAAAVFSFCGQAQAEEPEVKPVKYVFLFIGDGMATPQRMVTDFYLKEMTGEGLCMNSFPVQGYTTTYSADSLITDSAASATAMATGVKTYSGAIGMDINKEPVESVSEVAHKSGKKIGIVTTTSMNHATPGGFYSHQKNRGEYYKIAGDMINSGFEFFAGGGIYDNKGRITVNEKGWWIYGKEDQKDMYDLLKENGLTIVDSPEKFAEIGAGSATPIYVKNPHLAEEDTCFYAMDEEPDDITLAMNVAKAIEVLDNPNGFFIMTEGGKIDWTAHANDAAGTIAELTALDEAVQVAYNFALKHPDETLIVVTGDHETGALTLGFSGTGYALYLKNIEGQKKTLWRASNEFKEIKDEAKKDGIVLTFDDMKPYITDTFGLIFPDPENGVKPENGNMVLSDYEVSKLQAAFDRSMGYNKEYAPTESKGVMYGGYDPLMITATHLVSNKSGLAWASFHHSAMPVATSAYGVNSMLFGNISDNTDIAKNLRKVFEAK